MGIQNPSISDNYSVYFVTAKHVLYKPGTTDLNNIIFIRLNKTDGGSVLVPIPLYWAGPNRNVFTHKESSVDIAVLPLIPESQIFKYKFLPSEMVTTQDAYKKLKIAEGSEVFFTGLFLPYPGYKKNYPIVRFGRVALVSDEKIIWNGKSPMDLYLIEAGSFGGNSGSPVFFHLGSDREPGKLIVGAPVIKLAGIMKGTYLDYQEIEEVETSKEQYSRSNMGIAAVVPAYKLHEILFGDDLTTKRGF